MNEDHHIYIIYMYIPSWVKILVSIYINLMFYYQKGWNRWNSYCFFHFCHESAFIKHLGNSIKIAWSPFLIFNLRMINIYSISLITKKEISIFIDFERYLIIVYKYILSLTKNVKLKTCCLLPLSTATIIYGCKLVLLSLFFLL